MHRFLFAMTTLMAFFGPRHHATTQTAMPAAPSISSCEGAPKPPAYMQGLKHPHGRLGSGLIVGAPHDSGLQDALVCGSISSEADSRYISIFRGLKATP